MNKKRYKLRRIIRSDLEIKLDEGKDIQIMSHSNFYLGKTLKTNKYWRRIMKILLKEC